jgi:hypothetical protein
MRTTTLPVLNRFDHVINITPRQFEEMQGKPESRFSYCGSKFLTQGEWILFRTDAVPSTNHKPRNLVRFIKECLSPIPLFLDDDSQDIIVIAKPGSEYEVLMCEFNHFIYDGNVIKVLENPPHADIMTLPETRKRSHKLHR